MSRHRSPGQIAAIPPQSSVCYTLFGLAVLGAFVLVPPRWRKRDASA